MHKTENCVHLLLAPDLPSLRAVSLKKKNDSFGMTIQSHDEKGGVIITSVNPNSPANSHGVSKGDMILAVGGTHKPFFILPRLMADQW